MCNNTTFIVLKILSLSLSGTNCRNVSLITDHWSVASPAWIRRPAAMWTTLNIWCSRPKYCRSIQPPLNPTAAVVSNCKTFREIITCTKSLPDFVQFQGQLKKIVGNRGKGARVPVPHRWRHQCIFTLPDARQLDRRVASCLAVWIGYECCVVTEARV